MTKNMKNRIYVASSWRNTIQPEVVSRLREAGHEVYDFKNPRPGDNGFHWSDIESGWQKWNSITFRNALSHPIAERGFASDWNAMVWADTCVMVMPCGRSAHIEAGYFVGANKRLVILLSGEGEPELMYKMSSSICVSIEEVLNRLGGETHPVNPNVGPHL